MLAERYKIDMTLTLDLTSEQEYQIKIAAQSVGLSVEEYAVTRLLKSLEDKLPVKSESEENLTYVNEINAIHDPAKQLEKFIELFADQEAPGIELEDTSREAIYDRDVTG